MSDSGRPPTSRGRAQSGARPGTRGRVPGSSMGRPPTGFAMPAGAAVPGTAARPGSRGGQALASSVKVADRPVTQQGLTGIKTGARGPDRVVYDKTFYLGQLRMKTSELNSEVAKLTREIDQRSAENSTYLTYEKRAETLAGELKELQGQLADYNMLLDKANTETDIGDVVSEYSAMKARNDREEANLDVFFTEKQEKEQQLRDLEQEIERERQAGDDLIDNLEPEDRDRYAELKARNRRLQEEVDRKQQELDQLLAKTKAMEEEMAMSAIKQEAAVLHDKLNAVRKKRDALRQDVERETRETPAEEKTRLTRQIHDDNMELATLEKRATEMQDKVQRGQDELMNIERELEDYQGEKSGRFQELKKKEETMDDFFRKFEELKTSEEEKLDRLETTIVAILEHMSKSLVQSEQLPSVDDFKEIQEDLEFKKQEKEKSQMTMESLHDENDKLRLDLAKVEELESKISVELADLKRTIETLKAEIVTFTDLSSLRRAATEKKESLNTEKQLLLKQKDTFKKHLLRLSSQLDTAKAQLEENETYTQLTNLERKWQHHEQNNFAVKEFIAQKTAEGDYKPVKKNVKQELSELNQLIIHSLQHSLGY
ncbi:intraflagellar transport protein 74 homolog [Oscarella lobularis]|uniref:intraflagellar transport protein 74 homolog n=1 Tax=Oscarella lobularis TaxID=121494 RepID=UPI003313951A